MGSNSRETATDRTLNRPDRTRPVVPTVAATNYRSDASNVRSPATGHVRSQFRAPRTSLYSIGRCALRPVGCRQRPVASASSFLHDLAYGLVPIFVLGLCLISWVFSCASNVLLEVLIIGSSRRLRPSYVLHPIELQHKHLQIH